LNRPHIVVRHSCALPAAASADKESQISGIRSHRTGPAQFVYLNFSSFRTLPGYDLLVKPVQFGVFDMLANACSVNEPVRTIKAAACDSDSNRNATGSGRLPARWPGIGDRPVRGASNPSGDRPASSERPTAGSRGRCQDDSSLPIRQDSAQAWPGTITSVRIQTR